MIPWDEVLYQCNESELLYMARKQGLPLLRRGLPKEELVAIVAGAEPRQDQLAWSNYSRGKLEAYIQANQAATLSHVFSMGCDGRCRTFLCTEETHLACFLPNEVRVT